MDEDSLRLAELLCARLCHDLAGPAGAVSNGAELLEENDPGLIGEAAQLMAGAAGQLGHRLRFFRAAFGWEGGAAANLAQTLRIATDYLAPLPGQPPRFVMEVLDGQEEPGPGGLRLLLLLLLLGSESLPKGGTLRPASGDGSVSVAAQGNGAALPEDQAAVLTPGAAVPNHTPRTAPTLLALALAKRWGWQISVQTGSNRVELHAMR